MGRKAIEAWILDSGSEQMKHFIARKLLVGATLICFTAGCFSNFLSFNLHLFYWILYNELVISYLSSFLEKCEINILKWK